MGLDGQLQKMPFGEIFQTISLCKQSGVLTLNGGGQTGRLIFSDGRLLGASVECMERFGQALLCRGMITEEELEKALAFQRASDENLLFGEVLKNRGIVSEEVLQVELKRYLVNAVRTLLSWEEGLFHFEFGPAVNTRGMLLEEGLDLPSLLMEATRPKDLWHEGLFETTASPSHRDEWLHFLSLLSELLSSINSPQEAMLLVLRYASEALPRTVLFVVKGSYLLGAGQSGFPFPEEEADRRIKGIRIPLSNSSLFQEVVNRRETYKGALLPHETHQYFMDQVGSEWPPEVFLAPLSDGEHVIALLYGDQGLSGANLPDTRGLEAFVRVANLVSTKMFLERKSLARRGNE